MDPFWIEAIEGWRENLRDDERQLQDAKDYIKWWENRVQQTREHLAELEAEYPAAAKAAQTCEQVGEAK
jgi:hypothetical protein